MPTTTEWMIFLSTAIIGAVMPGPAMFLVVARSVNDGRRHGTAAAVGNGIGMSAHVVAATIGLSAVLADSPTAFTVIRYVGAMYLVYIGAQMMRARRSTETSRTVDAPTTGCRRDSAGSPLLQGAIIQTLSPKTALYFMALLPHFVHPDRANPQLVFALLGLIVVATALAADLTIAVMASRVGHRLASRSRWRTCQSLITGGVLVAMGAFVALR